MLNRMLSYTTRGDGSRAVLMLHGFLGSGRNLGLIARRWSARDRAIKIVLPDLTGHGTSPPLPPNADLAVLANDVLELAAHLQITEPFELIGHSLGGRVALRAAMLAPERIASTVLLDSTPARIDERPSEVKAVVEALMRAPESAPNREELLASLLQSGLSQGLSDWLMMNVVSEEDRVRWRIDRAALREMLERTRTEELWPAIEAPGAKVKLVWGAQSSFVPLEDRARFERSGGNLYFAVHGLFN